MYMNITINGRVLFVEELLPCNGRTIILQHPKKTIILCVFRTTHKIEIKDTNRESK